MGIGREAEPDFYCLPAVGGERSRVMPLLYLGHGVFGRAVHFQLDYIDVAGRLHQHVYEPLRGAVFGLNVQPHKRGETVEDGVVVVFIPCHILMQLIGDIREE